MTRRAALILAGGAGTRLWPMSTEERPKQFLPLLGPRSLLQQTCDRLAHLVDPECIYISTSGLYTAMIAEQLPHLPPGNILAEPARRNTAPAIACCCEELARRGYDSVAVFPSDHSIGMLDPFLDAVRLAFEYAETHDTLMTIGIEPTDANTGFGYLEMGAELVPGVVRVDRFAEKPDQATAERMFASGRFAWNGGMFVWDLAAFRKAMETAAPELRALARQYVATADHEARTVVYERMPSISIDYALMEKSRNVAAVRGNFAWSDLGSWQAVAEVGASCADGAIVLEEAAHSYVRSTTGRPVAVVGLDGVGVIDTPEGLLVVRLDRSGLVSNVPGKLKN